MRIALVATAICLTSTSLAAQTCSDQQVEEAILAEYASWSSLYAGVKRFAGCDDGGPAENFSDAVVHLLATQWSSLSEVARLVEKDDTFRVFLLAHINFTTDVEELRKVGVLANSKCPPEFATLCASIALSARQALSEAEHVP